MAKRLAEVGQKKRQPGCHRSLFDQVVWKQNQLGNLLSNSCRSEMIRTSRFPVNWSNTWTNVTLHVVELVTLASFRFYAPWRFDNLARHSDHKVEPDIKLHALQTHATTYRADVSHAAQEDTELAMSQSSRRNKRPKAAQSWNWSTNDFAVDMPWQACDAQWGSHDKERHHKRPAEVGRPEKTATRCPL